MQSPLKHRKFLAALALAVCSSVIAQQPPPPQFEVASVKLSPLPGGTLIPPVRSGRWLARDVTASALIEYAYGLHCCDLVVGGPQWIGKTGFAVEATVGTKTVPDAQLRLMVQNLLATRFKLKLKMSTRPEPAYVLELAPSGSKLRPAAGGCDPNASFLADQSGPPRCGVSQREGPGADTFTFIGRSITMAELAQFLETSLAVPERHAIVDRTGLSGRFDFDLTYHMINSTNGKAPMDDPESRFANYVDLQKQMVKQLGINFDLFHVAKVPLQVAMVQAIAMPSN